MWLPAWINNYVSELDLDSQTCKEIIYETLLGNFYILLNISISSKLQISTVFIEVKAYNLSSFYPLIKPQSNNGYSLQ